MTFSEWLKNECARNDISLNDLGKMLGLPESTIFNYTRHGNPHMPRWSTFKKICEVFNADPKEVEKLCGKRIATDYGVGAFGQWLDGKLKEFGMSLVDLARESGISPKTISGWKHGHADPRGRNYDRIVTVFDKKLEERKMIEKRVSFEELDKVLSVKDIYIVPGIYGFVENARVYDLRSSFIASGYPMMKDANGTNVIFLDKVMARANSLGNSPIGSGHDNFLCGIRVAFDLTFTNKAWVEAERYHFFDIVSSQSTMHRIEDLVSVGAFDDRVDQRIIDIVKELRDRAMSSGTPEDRLKLLYNIPSGLKLTARITTNYRQLKTIYQQRKNHRLPEWRAFCKWIETLPYADIFLMKGDEEK